MKGKHKHSKRGFSILEVMAVVGILAALAGLTYPMIGGIRANSQERALASDLKTLNFAVTAYVASGGSVSSATTETEVFRRLKTTLSEESRKAMPGFSSSFLDSRLQARFLTQEEIDSDGPRVTWDADKRRFLITREKGKPGIKEVYLSESVAKEIAEEERSFAFEYSRNGTWIWDFENDVLPESPSGPTLFATTQVATPNEADPLLLNTLPNPPVVEPEPILEAPTFSLPPGDYPIASFNLSVMLNNPNPSGSSDLIYSLDYSPWQYYPGGSLIVSPDSVIMAKAVPNGSGYQASALNQANYGVIPGQLGAPLIVASAAQFPISGTVSVGLSNPNDASISQLDYRLNGGAWVTYGGPFILDAAAWPGGVNIEAFAKATVPHWLESAVTSDSISAAVAPPVTSLLDADFDTSIAGTVPNWSGVSDQLYCNGLDPAQTLVYFNVNNTISGAATVTSAVLYLTRTAGSDGIFDAHGILPATGEWWNNGITWNTAGNGLQTDGVELDGDAQDTATPTDVIPGVPGWSYRNMWDITELVQRWVDNPTSNFGVALLGAPGQRIIYCSSEHPGDNVRPKLVINWTAK